MPHVALLGDSIFDNAAYVRGGPDVVTHLEGILPSEWSVTLLAIDGDVVSGIGRQLARLPTGTTHIVVSVGGNDALGHVGILERSARSVAEVLDLLDGMGSSFAERYRAMLAAVLDRGLPVTVCTVYEGALPDPAMQRRARIALNVFNDAIMRAAFEAGVPVIDLRLVCSDPGDYANPIEPSVQGGAKIARAILASLTAEARSAIFL